MKKIYAGIGSRTTPKHICALIENIAENLAWDGWLLRSGGAKGADSAFEKGCDKANGKKEIFLPWKNFNSNISNLYEPPPLAFHIAMKYHPYPNILETTPYVYKLMARNSQQILGQYCTNREVEFVLCWTQDGATKETTSRTGGTGQAIRIAIDLGIPVFNLGNIDSMDAFINAYLQPILDKKQEEETTT